ADHSLRSGNARNVVAGGAAITLDGFFSADRVAVDGHGGLLLLAIARQKQEEEQHARHSRHQGHALAEKSRMAAEMIASANRALIERPPRAMNRTRGVLSVHPRQAQNPPNAVMRSAPRVTNHISQYM